MSEITLIDKAAALERLGDDEELYQEIAALYCEDTPVQLKKLEEALQQQTMYEVERLSHSIKSASGNIGAITLSALALQIERQAHVGETENLATLIGELIDEFQKVKELLGRSYSGT